MTMSTALLDVDVVVDYPAKPRALDGVRFTVGECESVGVLGESGSGKSTLILAILGLLGNTGARVTGRIAFRGRNLLDLREREWRSIRGREIAYVPQSPVSALNPALRIGSQMAEAWRAHAKGRENDWKTEAFRLFERVSLPASDEFLRRFPSQISVGQAQRVLVAMALLHRPALLVSDEPTSAVDARVRNEVRDLLSGLSREIGVAHLLITHDLGTLAGVCSRVVVLEGGRVLREARMADLPPVSADLDALALSLLYAPLARSLPVKV